MRTGGFLRMALAAGALLLAGAWAPAQNRSLEGLFDPDPTPAPLWEGEEPATSPGSLRIENNSVNFGRVEDGTRVPLAYEIENRADFPVRIVNIATGCGCTSPADNPREIGPGETATLRFEFATAGRVGSNRQTITVLTDDPERSTYRLFYSGEVYTPFRFDPPALQLGTLTHGEGAVKEFSLLFLQDEPVEIKNVATHGDQRIRVEQIGQEPYEHEHGTGTRYRFRATVPEDFPMQQFTTVVRIEHDRLDGRPQNYMIRGEVAGELAFRPNRFFLVVTEGETATRSLEVYSRAERPFTVKSVEVVQGDIPAEFVVRETESLSVKEIVATVTGPEQARTIQGRVRIELEREGEVDLPALEVPAVVVVRPAAGN